LGVFRKEWLVVHGEDSNEQVILLNSSRCLDLGKRVGEACAGSVGTNEGHHTCGSCCTCRRVTCIGGAGHSVVAQRVGCWVLAIVGDVARIYGTINSIIAEWVVWSEEAAAIYISAYCWWIAGINRTRDTVTAL